MKQTFGITALIAVALAATRVPALLQEVSPPAAPALVSVTSSRTHPVAVVRSAYRGGCSAFDDAAESKAAAPVFPHDANAGSANAQIRSFFGVERSAELKQMTGVQYAIAIAPDPHHTNLSLWFDREIVAIQQAAQDEGFAYNSSWLPWRGEAGSYSRLEDQQRLDEEGEQREACPGVLLFRRGVSDPTAGAAASPQHPYREALVVFMVADQPTNGLNETQWNNAMTWMRLNASAATPRLSVLGPSFSGSLVSMQRELEDLRGVPASAAVFPSAGTTVDILSGSVSSCSSVRWFQQRVRETPGTTLFGTFQENDELHIHRLLSYLSQQDYRGGSDSPNSDVAILSEDETAYAAAAPPAAGQMKADAGGSPCNFPYAVSNQPLRVSYPRDISALRVAYEKQSVFDSRANDKATHPILQENATPELAPGAVTDTVRTYSGNMNAVAQEAVLYGIVSNLRAHHAHFLVLRCTNPLDFLFLTRFFHRAYPQGRIVTLNSDLLFRREIDTTEFRGVLSLSNYPLLPTNQHWSHVAPAGAESASHTHRIFDSQLQGAYLAARYLFDGQPITPAAPSACLAAAGHAQAAPDRDRHEALVLRFKPELPEFAVPFWLPDHGIIQAPTWLSVVGRDGYWPVAVLNGQTTPEDESLELTQRQARGSAVVAAPPSTLVQIDACNTQHDQDPVPPPGFRRSLLFGVTTPMKIAVGLAFLLLVYQLFGIRHGGEYTSIGLFSLFRSESTSHSHAVLLGVNSAFAAALLVQMLWVIITPRGYSLYMSTVSVTSPLSILSMLLALTLAVFIFFFSSDRGKGTMALVPFFAILLLFTLAPYAAFFTYRTQANGIPLFYRMAHLLSGVSPLVPVLLMVVGFYVWTWQALAGNSLLCAGHPRLPQQRGVAAIARGPYRRYLRFLGIDTEKTEAEAPELLSTSEYRISGEMEKHILKVANPLSMQARVLLLPGLFLLFSYLYGFFQTPPLLTLESHRFAACFDSVLLFAFLLTTTEACRFFFTFVELRRLLTALNRQRLRRTFAKLRAISAGSLWSVSGDVQRIQYLFFSEQQDAANRLTNLLCNSAHPPCPHVVKATYASRAFASRTAASLSTGARWEKKVVVNHDDHPELKGTQSFLMRNVMNDAVGEVINQILLPSWRDEEESLSLQTRPAANDERERTAPEMKLCEDRVVEAAEEFVCLHYIAFIQNVLARMRTMILSMVSLFVSVCFAISFYPFTPRTQIGVWMLVNLVLIGTAVIYVFAGLERDETLSYITNTPAGRLGADFYLKTGSFLAGPVIGLLTTQFPAISESLLGWIQPGFDALK